MVVAVIYLLLFATLVYKLPFFKTVAINCRWLVIVFAIKSAIAIGLCQWYYRTGFSGDMWVFYTSGSKLYDLLKTDPLLFLRILFGLYSENDAEIKNILWSIPQWFATDQAFNDNPFMFRVNAMIRIVSLGSFETHAVFFAFISMAGLTALYKTFESICTKNQFLMFGLVFLLPSDLFWLSGIFKETILLAVFGLLIYRFRILYQKPAAFNLIVTVALLLCLLQLRYYFVLCMLPAVTAYLVSKWKRPGLTLHSFASVYLFFFALSVSIHYLMPDLSPFTVLKQRQTNFINYAQAVNANSIIPVPEFDGTPTGFITALPMAFVNVFFKPFVTEIHSVPYGLLFIENSLLLLLIVMLIAKGRISQRMLPLCLAIISLSLSVLIIIGITTPVLGALVRYKSMVAPLLYPALLLLFQPKILSGLFSSRSNDS